MVIIGSGERRQSGALRTRWLSSAVARDGSPDRDFLSVLITTYPLSKDEYQRSDLKVLQTVGPCPKVTPDY